MSEDTTEQNRGPIAVDLTDDIERDRTTSGRVPRDNYTLRIVEEPTYSVSKEKFVDGKKKGGNPMLVFQLEIVDPSSVEADGEMFETAGIKFRLWAVFTTNQETGREGNRTLADLHKAGGLAARFYRDADTGLPVNDEGVPIRYTGVEFKALVDSEEIQQKSDGGAVLTNPYTGEELKGYQYSVKRIYVP